MPRLEDLLTGSREISVEPMTREGAIGSLRDACRRWNSLPLFQPGDLVRYAPGTLSEASVRRRNPTAVFVVLEVLENAKTKKDGSRRDHRLGFYDADNGRSVIVMDGRLFEPIPESGT